MNDLHNAYATLGVPIGSSMETITRRYKRLIMVWHPDRAHTPEQKEFAEEELKKINNAKDLFTKHFGSSGDHKASGCRCQAGHTDAGGASRGGSGPSPGPGPNYHRSKSSDDKQREEEAARKRDAERKRKEQEEANAKQAEEEAKRRQSAAAGQGMETAMQQQTALQDEKLRWRIAIGIMIAFVALEIFGSMAIGAKTWWHDMTWNWKWPGQQEQKPTDDTPPVTTTDTSTTTGTTTDTSTTTDTTPPVVAKEDPCSRTNPSSTPPDVILPYTHNWVRQQVTEWTVKCVGDNQGGTITGRDDKGRLLDLQEYGNDWTFSQQWTFKYGWAGSGEEITVDYYKPSFEFLGRSIYAYDQEHNLISIRQLDGHQRAIVTATIQRRPDGGFYQTILTFYDIETGAQNNTRTLYDPDDQYMSSTFYQYRMLGTIPKTVTLPSDPLFPTHTLPGHFGTSPLDPLSPSTTNTPSIDDIINKKYGLDMLPSTSTFPGSDGNSFFSPSKKIYTSPFAKPSDYDSVSPLSSPSKLSDLIKQAGLDSGTKTTPPSKLLDPDFVKKYGLGSGTLGAPTTNPSKLDELMKRLELDKPGATSLKKN